MLLNLFRNGLKSVDMIEQNVVLKKILEALGGCLHFVVCISWLAMTTTQLVMVRTEVILPGNLALSRNFILCCFEQNSFLGLMLVCLRQKMILTSFRDFIRSSRRLCLQHECRHKILFNKYYYQINSKRYD